MNVSKIFDECTGCTACAKVCPKECIKIALDAEGFYRPMIDSDLCIDCGLCSKVCHCFKEHKKDSYEKKAYYGYSMQNEVLSNSSSGGAFYHIATKVLNDGGVVYGAAFDYGTNTVKHMSTDRVPLSLLQKSKYVESELGDTFKEIEKNLAEGRKVLFCGTPCQVSGLKQLFKDNELLLCCDFVCHGVPSSKLFKEHLNNLLKKRTLQEIDFRPKEKGWDKQYLKLKIDNKITYKPFNLDSFCRGFVTSNAILRRSCYNCQFKQNHCSDITIADFWGYKAANVKVDIKKGMSLLVANTQRGEGMLEGLEQYNLNKLDFGLAQYIYKPHNYTNAFKLREKFFSLYSSKKDFEKAAKMSYMCGKAFQKYRLKYYIKQLLRYESRREVQKGDKDAK